MGKSFLKLGLLTLITLCIIACNPDDSLVTTPIPTKIESSCCEENGQLPSEPGEEEEEENSFIFETPVNRTTTSLCCGENGQLPSEPGEEEEEDEEGE